MYKQDQLHMITHMIQSMRCPCSITTPSKDMFLCGFIHSPRLRFSHLYYIYSIVDL